MTTTKKKKSLALRVRRLEARGSGAGTSVLYHDDWDGICAAAVDCPVFGLLTTQLRSLTGSWKRRR